MSIEEVLAWVVNSGGGTMVASWVLEQLKWYQGLESDKKRIVFFLSSFLITVAGFLVITYVPKETIDAISPYFLMLYGTFGSIFLGTAFHKATKLGKPEDRG